MNVKEQAPNIHNVSLPGCPHHELDDDHDSDSCELGPASTIPLTHTGIPQKEERATVSCHCCCCLYGRRLLWPRPLLL